jgi:hypothetical protein
MHKLYLLQDITEFKIQPNPLDAAGFLIVLSCLIALFIFLNVSKKVRDSGLFKNKGFVINKKNRVHVDSGFYHEVKHIGLNKREAAVLEKILKEKGEDPISVLYDETKTDEHFKEAYQNILRDRSGEEKLPVLLDLFSIRNAIEFFYANEKNTFGNTVVRNFRRKSIKSPCIFYLVISVNQDEKSGSRKELVVEEDCKYSGNMLDISQGGCAISINQSIKTGQMIKIEFTLTKQKIAALGQIIRFNKDGDNWIYHIKFLRMSNKSLVALNEYIFGYESIGEL